MARPTPWLQLVPLLAALWGCAAAPPPRYTAPQDGPQADVQLRLMPADRNRSAELYVLTKPSCGPKPRFPIAVNPDEGEPRLVAGSWEGRWGEVVRLPAGVPLPLRFRYFGPGEMFVIDAVVRLEPGQRYVFTHEIPGRRISMTHGVTGQPAQNAAVAC